MQTNTMPSLFLDRDGVINSISNGFVNCLEDFEFANGVFEAMRILSDLFKPIVVVTNQAGVGYGYLPKRELDRIHAHMKEEISLGGGRIDAVYYCPDPVESGSPCRKPNVGMALMARSEFRSIEFRRSWMVGDMESDMIFGQRTGMKTAWVNSGLEVDWLHRKTKADFYCDSLLEFSHFIKEQKVKL